MRGFGGVGGGVNSVLGSAGLLHSSLAVNTLGFGFARRVHTHPQCEHLGSGGGVGGGVLRNPTPV